MLILIPIGWLLAVGVGLTLDPSLIGWSMLYSLPTVALVAVAWWSLEGAANALTVDHLRRLKAARNLSDVDGEVVLFGAWLALFKGSIVIAAVCPLAVLWRLGGAS